MTRSGMLNHLNSTRKSVVLIPLLVDDPLWADEVSATAEQSNGLNPSFSG